MKSFLQIYQEPNTKFLQFQKYIYLGKGKKSIYFYIKISNVFLLNPLPHGGILYPIPRRRVTIDRAQRRL